MRGPELSQGPLKPRSGMQRPLALSVAAFSTHRARVSVFRFRGGRCGGGVGIAGKLVSMGDVHGRNRLGKSPRPELCPLWMNTCRVSTVVPWDQGYTVYAIHGNGGGAVWCYFFRQMGPHARMGTSLMLFGFEVFTPRDESVCCASHIKKLKRSSFVIDLTLDASMVAMGVPPPSLL